RARQRAEFEVASDHVQGGVLDVDGHLLDAEEVRAPGEPPSVAAEGAGGSGRGERAEAQGHGGSRGHGPGYPAQLGVGRKGALAGGSEGGPLDPWAPEGEGPCPSDRDADQKETDVPCHPPGGSKVRACPGAVASAPAVAAPGIEAEAA